MKKESLKTAALVLLVVCSIALTFNKWFSEKLWPDGYNFFSNLTSSLSFGKKDVKKTYYLSKENISNPSKIIVTGHGLRGLYTHTSPDYNTMLPAVKSILKAGLCVSEYSECDNEEWKNALKEASIYIAYPVAYDFATFSAIMDIDAASLGISSMKEFIIVSGDDITGKAHLLVKDASAKKIISIPLTADSVALDGIIEKYAVASTGEYPYSFELNFDKSNNAIEQKIIIEPQVLLSINTAAMPSVTQTNYFEDISENKTLYTKILRAFGYNTTNMQKYVNVDHSIVFAENYGSIRMHPDGCLEYRALDDNRGISLGTSSSASFYDTFIDCIEFINNVWDISCSYLNMDINLSSYTVSGQDSFKLSIDYYADGMEVISRLPKTQAHEKMNHAIEVTVKGGKIVSYRQIVSGYTQNSDSAQCPGVIEALDILMANDSIKSDTITDLYLAYNPVSDTNICTPCWVAKTDENEIRIIKNN